jgi:molybdopterin/thiamine biosynthesis adenylyltransferase/proteasome lid subunit RPN8/RPN11
MRYSITFLEEDYERLTSILFPADVERGAYLLCGLSVGPSETKLLVRNVVALEKTEINSASPVHISIPAPMYVKWLKRADELNNCIVFVHSHPNGYDDFSDKDYSEEQQFFSTAHNRIHRKGVHASLVLSSPTHVIGRVWLADGTNQALECIRIIGRRFRYIRNYTDLDIDIAFFDRQVRAFGHEFQPVLKRLHVGVVGAGGTGSSVFEQLVRLGIGTITIIDDDKFDPSNINRVYGAYSTDAELHKTLIAKRSANMIGLGTRVINVTLPITYKSSIEKLKDCDVIFGCTDDQAGRSLLTRFALYYLTPVIDVGVAIDSNVGMVERVEGRVTVLMPGTACLYCRRRISPKGISDEIIQQSDPIQADNLRKEGYLIGVQEPAPAVISFTTTIAASAVSELLHRLTGFMGDDRLTSEIIHRIDWNRVRTNSTQAEPDCFCTDRSLWGTGDTRPLLGVTWRLEP